MQQRVLTQVHGPRTPISISDDEAPLRHTVNRSKKWKPLLLQPCVRLLGLVIKHIYTGQLQECAVPVCRIDDAFELRAAPPLWHEAPRHKRVGAHAALPVAVLAALQGVVAGRPRLVDRTAVVGGKYDEGVVVHAACLEGLDSLPDCSVHVECHGRVEAPIGAAEGPPSSGRHQLVDLFEPEDGNLQGCVDQVEGVEEEERAFGPRHVMVPDDLKDALLEDVLFIAGWLRLQIIQAST
mmetsp:Transcript_1362/g.3959  ORF Transcript_1362/g.3959 Transcript_1362/m.3959 type:complete len:238 (-) Transcript_1362:707-1420(-)